MSDYFSQKVDYGPLFSPARMEFQEPKVLARRTDPPTSKAAAKSVSDIVSLHDGKILAALAIAPGNKDEIAAMCGLNEQQVIRRIARLVERGKVVDTGITRSTATGRMATVWRANTAASR